MRHLASKVDNLIQSIVFKFVPGHSEEELEVFHKRLACSQAHGKGLLAEARLLNTGGIEAIANPSTGDAKEMQANPLNRRTSSPKPARGEFGGGFAFEDGLGTIFSTELVGANPAARAHRPVERCIAYVVGR
jgi:hypothetical protein